MDYTVLARRFRPQAFGEVVGQERVAQALRNAISGERVAHAYLFTGARGVGKTSMARILAKSLNCPNVQNGDPCNQCDTCQGIAAGSDVDVLEIDGASNRGIEDIRSLRANVNVKSMRGRYKIYIIDEVHMLTREAFNALLKTLEEPPPNVKFIFCTTEPQKLPDTILSRCQRFDFGTIAANSIGQRLQEIALAEGVQVEPAAIELVARRAAGSMRDSQSLFDQLLAFGGKTVAPEDVHRLLGTAPDERLIEFASALIQRNSQTALEIFDVSLNSGVQLSELIDQLLSYLRDLMVLAAGATEAGLLSVADGCRPILVQQAQAWGLQTILAALQILAEAKGRMRGVTYGRVLAELALVRIATLENLEEINLLVQQLKTGKFAATARPTGALPAPSVSGLPSASAIPRVAVPSRSEEPPAPQKKNDGQRAAEVSSESAEETANAVLETVEQVATIPWEAGQENAIWTEVISHLSPVAKSAAKNATRVAISGPNQLVLAFSKGYHKLYFERAEELSRLEKVLSQVAGRQIRVLLELDETADATPEEPAATTPVGRTANPIVRPETVNDPLVKSIMNVFGATVVRVDNVSAPPSE